MFEKKDKKVKKVKFKDKHPKLIFVIHIVNAIFSFIFILLMLFSCIQSCNIPNNDNNQPNEDYFINHPSNNININGSTTTLDSIDYTSPYYFARIITSLYNVSYDDLVNSTTFNITNQSRSNQTGDSLSIYLYQYNGTTLGPYNITSVSYNRQTSNTTPKRYLFSFFLLTSNSNMRIYLQYVSYINNNSLEWVFGNESYYRNGYSSNNLYSFSDTFYQMTLVNPAGAYSTAISYANANYNPQSYANAYSNGYNDGYSVGSNDGYTSGYNVGLSDGYEDGYDNGYSVGTSYGFSVGYTDGVNYGYNSGLAQREYADQIEFVYNFDWRSLLVNNYLSSTGFFILNQDLGLSYIIHLQGLDFISNGTHYNQITIILGKQRLGSEYNQAIAYQNGDGNIYLAWTQDIFNVSSFGSQYYLYELALVSYQYCSDLSVPTSVDYSNVVWRGWSSTMVTKDDGTNETFAVTSRLNPYWTNDEFKTLIILNVDDTIIADSTLFGDSTTYDLLTRVSSSVITSSTGFLDVFSLISQGFGSMNGLFSVGVVPGITIGTLLLLPLMVIMIITIIRLIKK